MSKEQAEMTGVLVPRGLPATEMELIDLGVSIGAELMGTVINGDAEIMAISKPMREASTHAKMLEKHRKDHLAPIRDYVTKVNAEYKRATDELDKGLRHAKAQVSAYQFKVQQEKDRLAREEAARIQRNAEKRAETQRKQEEAAQKAAAEAAAAAEAEGASEQEIADARAAQELAEQQAIERAEAAENIRIQAEVEAEHAAAAIATQEKAKAEGVSTRKDWKMEVVDKPEFIRAVAAGDDSRLSMDMLKVEQPVLNRLAKALKEGCKGIKGVRVFYTDVVSVRSSK